jgi:zinc/manganese transport system substrate-binding protein
VRHAALRAGLPVLALLLLPACSDDGAPDSRATVVPGDPAACPGEVLDVVVSVGAWSDVVGRLGGDCATVTTIAGTLADVPGDVVPADRDAFAAADLVVVNGARYDQWAVDAAEQAGEDPAMVSAADVAGSTAGRPDPQLWYDPEVVPEVAATVARELARLSPDAAPYFDAQHTAWTAELQPYLAAVAGLREEVAGRTWAATSTAYAPTARAVGLGEATPRGFLRSLRAGDAPSSDDVDAFDAALRDGSVDVLIQDEDGEGAVHDRLREVADDADVPVVEVTEFPPEDAPFVEWQLAQLGALREALAEDG